MLTQEILVEIHVLHRQGKSIRSIAKALNVSRNTVRKYLRDIARTPTYSRRDDRPSKLEPFKTYLLERIEAARPEWIPATVLFRELQAKGYDGKEGILRNYIRQFKRPLHNRKNFAVVTEKIFQVTLVARHFGRK